MNKDLTIVGLMFCLIIQFGISVKNSYEIKKLKLDILNVKKIAIELNDRYEIAIDNLNSLNEYADSQEKESKDCNDSSRLIKELR